MSSRRKADSGGEPQSTEVVYAAYEPPQVADRVEVRINNKIVFLNDVYGAKVDVPAGGGVNVKGSNDAPKTKKTPDQPLYDPTKDEPVSAYTVTSTTESSVPVTDPEYTKESAAQFEDADEKT